jgi:hypothetical protein
VKTKLEQMEELAWKATERAQIMLGPIEELEERLKVAKEAYRRAEVLAHEAWGAVYAQAGGKQRYMKQLGAKVVA